MKSNRENKTARIILTVVLILSIVMGLAARAPIFFRTSLTSAHLDQVLNYFLCIGQLNTARLMPIGNTIFFGLGKLGPFVLYVYSAALNLWKSPLCLIVLSLVVNLAAPAVLFLFFRRRGETRTGLLAAAILLTAPLHAQLAGETWPHMILPFAAILWLFLFIEGMERKSVPEFLVSFVFLSLATNSHFTGFILIPVGAVLWMVRKPQIGRGWIFAGIAMFLIPYTLYIADAWKQDWAPAHTFFKGVAGLAGGSAYGLDGGSIFQRLGIFERNYFEWLNPGFGLLSLVSLAAGLREMIISRTRRQTGSAPSDWAPWALIQMVSLAALFFANNQQWYFLMYFVGSVGSVAIFMSRALSSDRAVPRILVPLLLLALLKGLYQPGLFQSGGVSYFPYYNKTRELVDAGRLSPLDLPRVHDIPSGHSGMSPGLEWYTAIVSGLPSTGASRRPRHESNIHYLFNFSESETKLTEMLMRNLPDMAWNKYYSAYTSRIDPAAWRMCADPMDAALTRSGGPSECVGVRLGWRSDIFLKIVVYPFYPELKKLRARAGTPPELTDEKYTFIADMKPAARGIHDRLIVIQTSGITGAEMAHNGKTYRAAGRETIVTAGENPIAYTWFVIPAAPGPVAFEWRRKPLAAMEAGTVDENTTLDIMDIDMLGK